MKVVSYLCAGPHERPEPLAAGDAQRDGGKMSSPLEIGQGRRARVVGTVTIEYSEDLCPACQEIAVRGTLARLAESYVTPLRPVVVTQGAAGDGRPA